ncbi:MAG: phenylacetate--CoA ligase family protein, partial [Longimicrobiales bacterium]
YYRRVMDAAGIRPEDVRTLADLRSFPVLERSQLREAPEELLSSDGRTRRLRWQRTNGTTGTPVRYARCEDSRAWAWASIYRFYRWMGVRPGDPRLVLWGERDFVAPATAMRRLSRRMWRETRLVAYQTSDADIDAQARAAARTRVVLLRGYASAVYRFAERAGALGIRIPTLRAVTTTADALLPAMRRTIEDALGVPVFDQYACGEVIGGAYECEARRGLHVVEEHNVIEVDAPGGEEGDILMTDLDNFAMPLIRYRNGDQGAFETTPCACGRASRRLQTPIGRAAEIVILPDTQRLNRTFFKRFFNQFQEVRTYQIAQTGAERYEIRIEEGEARDRAELEQGLRGHFGTAVELRFRYGPIAPLPGGKVPIIVKADGAGEPGRSGTRTPS